jgi:hypothetical protein
MRFAIVPSPAPRRRTMRPPARKPLQSRETPQTWKHAFQRISKGFQRTSKDFKRISKDFQRFQNISKNFRRRPDPGDAAGAGKPARRARAVTICLTAPVL